MTFANGELPRITVITPCLNGERYIVEAIESVLRQSYPHYEHIVVDGGSTDRTVELLQRYPHLTIIRGCDQGSHDAMNIGLARATGDIIGFLNVDDVYPPLTLHRAARAFVDQAAIDVVVGDSLIFEEVDGARQVRFVFRHPQGVWLPECLFGNPAVNGCFFRRDLFDRLGLFNNDFTITADRDFFVRMAVAGVTSVPLNQPTILYRAHPGSQTINRERANMAQIAAELLDMASLRCRAAANNPRDRHTFRFWRALEGARSAVVQFRGGQRRDALAFLVRCNLRHPLWPLQLAAAAVLRRLARRSYRGGWNADLSGDMAERRLFDASAPYPTLAATALGLSDGAG
jgi:glycosyltransferase involved in cell wall biosynthesis